MLLVKVWLIIVTSIVLQSLAESKDNDMAAMFSAILESERDALQEPCDDKSDEQWFDFVIIGAGPGGCTVANRLTEIEDWEVLVLEAGGEETAIMDIPNLNSMIFTDNFWIYKTVPSKTLYQSFAGQQVTYRAGKTMGGGSTVNGMYAVRGNRYDYDNWKNMGNEGWGFDDVLPYFRKVENIQIPELRDSRYHSTEGNIKISYPPYTSKMVSIFTEGGKELGYSEVDHNGEYGIGFSRTQTTTFNGTRWSASRGYLHPIRDRPNLHVKKRAVAMKILINETTNTAYGVYFTKGGKNYTVYARKEVVLSAGALKSPQLLMLSGVGPRDHLEELGIEVIKDSKVGYSVIDHPTFLGLVFTMNETMDRSKMKTISDPQNFYNYYVNKAGPLTNNYFTHGVALLDLKDTPNYNLNWANVGVYMEQPPLVDDGPSALAFGFTSETANTFYGPLANLSVFSPSHVLLRPTSRGRIKLQDKSILTQPLYDPNILSNEEEIQIMLEGLREMMKLAETPAFQSIGTKLYDVPLPACKEFQFGSDDYWRCAVLQTSFPSYHASGSCKMGPATDESAVVDPTLKVYGLKGLRIADFSICPQIPALNPMFSIYMIGEKAADMIKKEYLDESS